MKHSGIRVCTVCVLLLLLIQLGNLGTIGDVKPMTQGSDGQIQEEQDTSIDSTNANMQELEDLNTGNSEISPVSPIQSFSLILGSPDLAWTTGGDADWLIDTSTSNVGSSSARSGDIGNYDQSWIETTISGPAIVSFDWRVSSEGNFDFLRFFIDGAQKDAISGSRSWAPESFEITTWGSHTLRWTYTKDVSLSYYEDSGWVDNVLIHDVDYALEGPNLAWTSGGDADWLIDTATFNVGSSSVRSGDIGNYDQSWIETTIEGPAIVSFDWKVSSETNFDFLRFYIDGVRQDSISGSRSWAHESFEITTWGSHTLRWTYTKDVSLSYYEDSGWVDKVLIHDVDYALEGPDLAWTSGGDADWFISASTSGTGGTSLQSGDIGNYDQSWIETTISGPAIISFDWKVSSETNFDFLRFHVDGVRQDSISGSRSWAHESFEITTWGSHTLRWTYTKDVSLSYYEDSGWVDKVLIHDVDYALEGPDLAWTSGGDADWLIDTATFNVGSSSVRSGDIGNYDQSWIETTISGPAIISFDWKVSSETNFDFLRFFIDGAQQAAISGSRTWAHKAYEITTWGSHTLRWSYTKDVSLSYYEDSGWVDNIRFSPFDDAIDIELTTSPQDLQASIVSDQVQLTWDPPLILGDSPFIEYRVYRGTSPGSVSFYASVEDTYFADTAFAEFTDYYYEVSAVNVVGEGPRTDSVMVSIEDDDTMPPEIDWEYFGNSKDGDPGYIVVTASDASGLTEDPSGTYYLTSDLVEQRFNYTAVDADNDRPDDSLSTTVIVTIDIEDDDITAPIITWEYFGSYTDGDAGYIEVTASDASGLSVDPSGTYYLSNATVEQSFEFTAVDADNDRPDDELGTTIAVNIAIEDDDTTAPEVLWEYFGSYTDGDPGYIVVSASDASGLSEDPSGTYYLSSVLGELSFTFTAVDADNDRPDDSLSTTVTVTIEIEDDDTTAPEILWEYFGSNTDGDPGYVVVTATDASGLSEDPSGTYYLTSPLGEQSFTFTAVDADEDRPHDQMSTTITVSIVIEDDDTTAPEILWEYFGSTTDGDPGYIVVTATDASGLSEDPSGTYFLSPALGQQRFEFTAVDDDNDRPDDRLGTTIDVTIEIEDDDISTPEVEWEYFGSNTDGDPGYIVVTATDASGLSQDPSGTYYLTSELGDQLFEFVALDADEDRFDDQLSATVTVTINIVDDDTLAPEIQIEYLDGDGTDANPGYFAWTITDVDDGIGGDGDSGFSEIEVTITYESVDGLGDYSIVSFDVDTGTWNLQSELGTYSITVFARDNDDDRTLAADSLTTELALEQEIIDDDTDPPNVSNLLVTETETRLIVTFSASDCSGIASVEILIVGQVFTPVAQSQESDSFTFEYSTEIFFGTQTWTHLLEISVTDGDDDRPFDDLTAYVSESFVLSPDHLLRFILYELLTLKAEVDEDLEGKTRRMLDCLLDKAIDRIRDALESYLEGRISRSLMLERLSKVTLEFSEIIAIIGECRGNIDEAFAQHLVDRLHEIRDHITYAMGASVGTDTALAIADAAIKIDRFADGLYESMSFWDALLIDINLRQAVRRLDQSLIHLARGHDCAAAHKLAKAVRDLAQTKCWIRALERFGRIPGDLADGLISEIDILISSLQQIVI